MLNSAETRMAPRKMYDSDEMKNRFSSSGVWALSTNHFKNRMSTANSSEGPMVVMVA